HAVLVPPRIQQAYEVRPGNTQHVGRLLRGQLSVRGDNRDSPPCSHVREDPLQEFQRRTRQHELLAAVRVHHGDLGQPVRVILQIAPELWKGLSGGLRLIGGGRDHLRSEEHTSELQSRENLVCRLLLEKKKKT